MRLGADIYGSTMQRKIPLQNGPTIRWQSQGQNVFSFLPAEEKYPVLRRRTASPVR